MGIISFFGGARQAALSLGLIILLPLTVSQFCDIVLPVAAQSEQVTAKFGTPEFKEQFKNYQEFIKPTQMKRFYVSAAIGLATIVTGVFMPAPTVGTGLLFGGISCLTAAYATNWNQIDKIVRFISLVCAIIILLFSGLYFWKKN